MSPSGTVSVDSNGGFNASVNAPGDYTFSVDAQGTLDLQTGDGDVRVTGHAVDTRAFLAVLPHNRGRSSRARQGLRLLRGLVVVKWLSLTRSGYHWFDSPPRNP